MMVQSRLLQPEGDEGDYFYIQQGIMFINCNGRRSRQETIARALRMAPRPPDFICLVETNTRKWMSPAQWGDYQWVAHNHRSRLRYQGIEIYRHKNCPYKVVTAAASAKGDALLVQVFTQDTNYGILVVHAPHARKVTNQGYLMYWLRLWAKVRRQIDTRRVIMVGDMNSAFAVKDRKKQRATDTIYRRVCGKCRMTRGPVSWGVDPASIRQRQQRSPASGYRTPRTGSLR